MPAPLAEVVRSRGPAVQTTFDDDTKKKPRERIAANEPNGFLRHSGGKNNNHVDLVGVIIPDGIDPYSYLSIATRPTCRPTLFCQK